MAQLAGTLEDMLRLAEMEKPSSSWPRRSKRPPPGQCTEYVMIPNTQEAIRYITMKLDENDRATTTRLMKVKDMLLKEAIEEQRARDEAAMSRFTAQET